MNHHSVHFMTYYELKDPFEMIFRTLCVLDIPPEDVSIVQEGSKFRVMVHRKHREMALIVASEIARGQNEYYKLGKQNGRLQFTDPYSIRSKVK